MKTAYCVVSALGIDEPGVVATLCKTLTATNCNISQMSQSNIKNQFASLFIIEKPTNLDNGLLKDKLSLALKEAGLRVSARVWDLEPPNTSAKPEKSEPFVVSIYGGDRNDIVGTFAEMFAKERINIENLRAMQPQSGEFMLVYEVLIPAKADIATIHKRLIAKAQNMGLELTLQHRDIFEAINRIQVV